MAAVADEDLKAKLFKARLPEEEVDVPGVGTVRIRALSRAEAMKLRKMSSASVEVIERKLIALAMVDPVLTEDEVGKWQEASTAGELEVVSTRVSEISGMTEGAAKEAYKEFDADPDAEFRLPAG